MRVVSSVDADTDDTALARIRAVCSQFPDAAEGVLQDRPLFHVRRRRFAIFNGELSPPRRRWQGFGRSLHFATDPQQRVILQSDARFVPSPHHGFRGWIAIDLESGKVPRDEICALLELAYRAVAGRELVAELDQNPRLLPG